MTSDLCGRLVSVVEQRNEIVTMLEMERIREIQEDATIDHHMGLYAGTAATRPSPDRPRPRPRPRRRPRRHGSGEGEAGRGRMVSGEGRFS